MIGWVCFILAILILWSIVASWEEVEEDKPIPPAPKPQGDNRSININSHWRPAEHGDANIPKSLNSPQGSCQPPTAVQSGLLTSPRRSHDSPESTV
ncbi:hypothetical protein M413DRAFT_440423 [Hebeloma cylindrosporum]|uniref:Secreted protein n=1 Tax=Hebeloma cylindrosporum TaxID=76867 RepID=A0A0C3CRY9_HEBCY|nr:hypothetical protein M413DRAFT_440423 [Hebeloma cylindrosporum h7]